MANVAFLNRASSGSDVLPSKMLAATPQQHLASSFHRISFTAIVASTDEPACRMNQLGEAVASDLVPISGGCTIFSCRGLWCAGADIGPRHGPPEKAHGVVLHVTVEPGQADQLYHALRASAAHQCSRLSIDVTWVHCEINSESSLAGHFRLDDQLVAKESR